jgi:DNA adenine methylase
VEPYAGAASVLMRKQRSRAELINDLDDRIVNVFRVLRDPVQAQELRRRMELTAYARTEFDASYDEPTDAVDDALKMLCLSFMGQGSDSVTRGHRTGFRSSLRNREGGALASHDWAGWPSQIPVFVERLQGVTIERGEALQVILRMDSPTTLLYVDPPYLSSTRNPTRKHGYRHEMTDEDHVRLAEVLREVEGMVVISGYASALYDELYGDWTRRETNTAADRGREATEVVWLNPACEAGQRQMELRA